MLPHLVRVALADHEIGRLDRQPAVALHGEQAPRLRQPVERGAQVLADHAGNFARMSDDLVERSVLDEPLRRGLRADLRNTGHVVDGVPGQREEIEQLVRTDAELGDHARLVERFIAHRVDELHAWAHELREILVARRDHRRDPFCGRLPHERSDHVVGLDAVDHQQRPAVGADELVQRARSAVRDRRAWACGSPCTRDTSRRETSFPGASKTTAK